MAQLLAGIRVERSCGALVTDLILLVPELVLVGMALALILVARHVRRAPVAAAWWWLPSVAAACLSGRSRRTPRTGFGGTIAGDGYAPVLQSPLRANLALAALLSVRHLEAERVPPAEYYAPAPAGLDRHDAGRVSRDLLILYLGLELMTCARTSWWDHARQADLE